MLSPEELPPESISMNQLVLSSARVARHVMPSGRPLIEPLPSPDPRLFRARLSIRGGVGISRPYFAVTFVVFGRVCRKSRRRHVFTRYRVRGRRTEEVLVVVVVDHVRA